MTTTTTGTGTITLGSAVTGFKSFADAGVSDAEVVTYAISDGSHSEIGRGTYTASGTTLSRTVLKSTNSNAAISLSGSAQVFITPAAEDLAPMHGQCRLTKSGSNLLLSRYNGSALIINGNIETVPSSGPTLAATGATANTTYYIYAYMSSGTMTLERSATAYATHTDGVIIKSGDATRTLVGMARAITGPAWQDTADERFVRSWFNRQTVSQRAAFSANRSTTSTTYVELNTEIRVETLIWSGEIWSLTNTGVADNDTAGAITYTSIGIDDATAEAAELIISPPTATYYSPYTVVLNSTGLSEGYHYATAIGKVSSGTGAWFAANQTVMHGIVGTS